MLSFNCPVLLKRIEWRVFPIKWVLSVSGSTCSEYAQTDFVRIQLSIRRTPDSSSLDCNQPAHVKSASFTKRVVKPAPVSRPLQLNNQKKKAKNDAVAKLIKENKDERLRNGLAVIKASKEGLAPLKEEGSKANNIPAAPI